MIWFRELRRVGLSALAATPAAIVAGALVTVLIALKGGHPRPAAGFWVREILPLAFGIAGCAVPAAEQAMELQLSLPTGFRRTLARRLTMLLAWGSGLTASVTATADLVGWWRPTHGILVGQLTWLAPGLTLGGLGLFAALATGTAAAGAAVVGGLWLVQDLTGDWYTGHGRLVYLFATDTEPGWTDGRITLLAIGALALAACWAGCTRPSHLLNQSS